MTESEGRHRGRRRPPSPEAKRLMIMSAVASIGLAVVLSVVFLPILLKFEERLEDPLYELVGETTGTMTNVSVDRASFPRPFTELGFLLINGSVRHEEALDPSNPIGPVSYADADGDGTLNVGDYFLIQVEPGRQYVLLITLLDDERTGGVGRYAWTA